MSSAEKKVKAKVAKPTRSSSRLRGEQAEEVTDNPERSEPKRQVAPKKSKIPKESKDHSHQAAEFIPRYAILQVEQENVSNPCITVFDNYKDALAEFDDLKSMYGESCKLDYVDDSQGQKLFTFCSDEWYEKNFCIRMVELAQCRP